MKQTENSIVNDIVCYIRKTNTPLTEWYVGIAEDAQAGLFKDHEVHKDRDYWIYRECLSVDVAQRVVWYFIANYQMEGRVRVTRDVSRFVYAYKKERHTKEE